MEKGEPVLREGKSLEETPTWALATVITVMVAFGFLVHHSLKRFGRWLEKTKRKSVLAALEKIEDELMLFGVLSLLMGHWIEFFAKICIKSSSLNSRFYPCPKQHNRINLQQMFVLSSKYSVRLNSTVARELEAAAHRRHEPHDYCPEGKDSFASYESLEQLHHFIFLLGVTHVSYTFIAIALAMIKIYSWRAWENHAKASAAQPLQESSPTVESSLKIRRQSTFIAHNVSHPWSQHGVLVWLLCFSRQFWSSINQADYMALRLGFITTHELPLTYDFHNYMVRSMEDEFRDIVGIRLIWLYWISIAACPSGFIAYCASFLTSTNAFEMASFLWSLWEIKDPSCFMENRAFLVTRLAFGIISQCWCSYITFPLYVIVTQMGSKFKSGLVSENVRRSLSKWKRRVQEKQSASNSVRESPSTSSLDSMGTELSKGHGVGTSRYGLRTTSDKDSASPSQHHQEAYAMQYSPSSFKGNKLKAPHSYYSEDDYSPDYDHVDARNNDESFDAEDEIHHIEP
ncbi:spartin-like [Hibiscus syriacus]|uniref:MLO-like protein n=1 Tax=Hibiscus syriacus TaxID=106335 RepID=A0A6A2WAD7_HIBSY|nr:spartin-like [Hibiscus syriacus]